MEIKSSWCAVWSKSLKQTVEEAWQRKMLTVNKKHCKHETNLASCGYKEHLERVFTFLPFLFFCQAAQQIIELQEAAQINAGLQPANLGRNTSLHDMKTVVKTWRNRLPIVSDDLSHWSSIFMWRQHHYQGTNKL